MANNSSSLKRHKRKLEPISIDELAGDSTMTGFSDLFKIPTGPNLQSPSASTNTWKRPIDILKEIPLLTTAQAEIDNATVVLETSGPVSSNARSALASAFSFDGLDTAGRVSVDYGQPRDDDCSIPGRSSNKFEPLLETTAVDTGEVKTKGNETVPLVSTILRRKLQIREARLVQEGHTYGEQTVYEALWKNGTVVSDSVRLLTIGFSRMAGIAGLAESNCKAAIAGLLDKLAIERLPDKNVSQGHTYRIYSWTAVLSRRRAAGLTHVIKSRGVVFVDPRTGQQLTLAKTPSRGLKTALSKTIRLETDGPVSKQQIVSSHSSSLTPVPLSSIPRPDALISFTVQQTAITDLAARLRNDLDPTFDDSAAGRLWRECHTSVPDCSTEEILHFVTLKAQKIYRDRNIRNPIGLLLMSIPDFFTGGAVHELRKQKGREEQHRQEMQEQQRKYWTDVAQDSKTPPEERKLASKFLEEMG